MVHRRWFELAGRLLGLLAGLAATAPALAHPHVWVDARAEIVFDATARVIGIRHTWIFDPAYSAYTTMGLDTDGDGNPDPEKLAQLAETNLLSLAEAEYFTTLEVNGSRAAFATPGDYEASIANDRLVLRFLLPLKSPTKPTALALHVGDPTFFTAFAFPDRTDALLAGAPQTCTVSINPPAESQPEDVERLAQDIAAVLRGQLNASTPLTRDPAGQITVVCPRE